MYGSLYQHPITCTHIYTHRYTVHTHTHTHIYSMHSFTHSVIHTYNIMRWLLSSRPVCLVWGRTKNNISLLSVVTGTVWVWRAGGVVSLWFIENSGRPTWRSNLTSPLTLEKLGRKQWVCVCVCVLHGSAQETCCIPVSNLQTVVKVWMCYAPLYCIL